MNNSTLGNILSSAAPGEGFVITSLVNSESDYNTNVVYNDPSKKPTWSVVQSGEIPEQWKVVRGKRDDVPLDPSVLAEWETYRQDLRDVTDQSDPLNIVWPTPPA